MRQGFLSALRFLTVLPFGRQAEEDAENLSVAPAFFPLIGLLLGLVLAGVNQLLLWAGLNPLLANVILVTLLIILTGALHLDGLADTCDALGSGKSRAQMLEIMRDAHLGTMGVLGLILVIFWKVALLYSLKSPAINPTLILMCLFSRYGLVLSLFCLPYARQEGKAKVFIGLNWQRFSWVTLFTLSGAVILAGLKGVIIFLSIALFTLVWGRWLQKKIGGITGDTLGALDELGEVLVLFLVLILGN